MGLDYVVLDTVPPRTVDRAVSLEYEQVVREALRLPIGKAIKVTDRKRPADTIAAGLRSAARRLDPDKAHLAIYLRAGHVYVAKIA